MNWGKNLGNFSHSFHHSNILLTITTLTQSKMPFLELREDTIFLCLHPDTLQFVIFLPTAPIAMNRGIS